ncbi:MAG: M56 family metallopeptidase [Thermoanaerobaculia bacterium]|nr:M56 family metallopeptidase [Thermoanaerobaculia bacterium]
MNLPDLTLFSLPVARALVHFLWQGALVALLTGAVLACMRRARPGSRYAVALGGLLLMAAMPWMTLTMLPAASSAEARPATVSGVSGDFAPILPLADHPTLSSAAAPASLMSSWDGSALLSWIEAVILARPAMLVAIWAVGVLLLLTIHLGGLLRLRAVLRDAMPAPSDWQACLDHLARSVGTRRIVELRQSSGVDMPMVSGWLRPVIVVPASAFFGLAPEQLEAVLSHELAHVRRQDFLVNLFQVAMETVFFYHPAVWWLSRRVRIEREHCCDDLAVGLFDAPVYVRALAALEGMRSTSVTPSFALGADGGSLLARVRRLAEQDTVQRSDRPSLASRMFGTTLAAVLAAGLAAAGVYWTDTGTAVAQPAAEPTAETDDSDADNACLACDEGAGGWSESDDWGGNPHWGEREDRSESDDRGEDADWGESEDRSESADWGENSGWDADDDDWHDRDWVDEGARELRSAAAGTQWSNLDDETFRQLARWGFDERLFAVLESAGMAASSEQLERLARYGIDEDLISAVERAGLPADFEILAKLARHGVDGEDLLAYQRAGVSNGEDVLRLARYGLDGDDIAELKIAGYPNLSVEQLLELARHGLDGDDVSEFAASGHSGLSVDQLVTLARHGLDGDDIGEFAAAGYSDLSVDELVRLARHGVDGDDIEELRRSGHSGLSVDDVIELARHGVDGDDIAGLTAAGLTELSLDQIRDLARHGVDGDDVMELREAGLEGLTLDEILDLARHGIDGDDVAELNRAGLTGLSLDQIGDLARHGVDGDDVMELREAGLEGLALDEILDLARHGVDGDDVEELRRGGLTDLSVDQILRLARYGIDADDLEEVRAAGYDVTYDEVMRLARSGRLWHLDDDDDHDDDGWSR